MRLSCFGNTLDYTPTEYCGENGVLSELPKWKVDVRNYCETLRRLSQGPNMIPISGIEHMICHLEATLESPSSEDRGLGIIT